VLLWMRHHLRNPATRPQGDEVASRWLRSPDHLTRQHVLSFLPEEVVVELIAAIVIRYPIGDRLRMVQDVYEDFRVRVLARPLAGAQTFVGLLEQLAGEHAELAATLSDLDTQVRHLGVRGIPSAWAMAVVRSAAPTEAAAQAAYAAALLRLHGWALPVTMTLGEYLRWFASGRPGGGEPPPDGPRPRPFNLRRLEIDLAREAKTGTRRDIRIFRERLLRTRRLAGESAATENGVAELIAAGEEIALGGYESSPADSFDRAVYRALLARYHLLAAAAHQVELSAGVANFLREYVLRTCEVRVSNSDLAQIVYSCRGVTADEAVRRAALDVPFAGRVVRAVQRLLSDHLGGRGMAGSLAAELTGAEFGEVTQADVDASLRRIRYRVRVFFGAGGPGDLFGREAGQDDE
jgi:hypothetical protein